MNTLKINDIEYDMSSPSGLEFKKKYITSFGDTFGPSVDVSWHHVNGFYLEIKSDSEDLFTVEIIDNSNKVIYKTTLKSAQNGESFCKNSYEKVFCYIKMNLEFSHK